MTEALVMRQPDFSKVFKVTCVVSGLAIGGVLSKKNHLIAYFNEKLNDVCWRYSTYDKKFYAVMQTLRYWIHYLLPYEFVLYSDHETLKYLNSQKRLNTRYSKWVEFLQNYTFVLNHRPRVENQVADALSRRVMILVVMSTEVIRFESLREEYESCSDFG